MAQLKPKDIVAIIVLLCAVFLIFNNIASPLTELIALVIGYYFGERQSDKPNGN